jgi:hypothetical protein
MRELRDAFEKVWHDLVRHGLHHARRANDASRLVAVRLRSPKECLPGQGNAMSWWAWIILAYIVFIALVAIHLRSL